MQLGYHTGGDSGLRMVHTYSRDALAEPLAKLVRVLTDIRLLRFRPDCTRSGRFNKPSDASVQEPAKPMSVGDRVAMSGAERKRARVPQVRRYPAPLVRPVRRNFQSSEGYEGLLATCSTTRIRLLAAFQVEDAALSPTRLQESFHVQQSHRTVSHQCRHVDQV